MSIADCFFCQQDGFFFRRDGFICRRDCSVCRRYGIITRRDGFFCRRECFFYRQDRLFCRRECFVCLRECFVCRQDCFLLRPAGFSFRRIRLQFAARAVYQRFSGWPFRRFFPRPRFCRHYVFAFFRSPASTAAPSAPVNCGCGATRTGQARTSSSARAMPVCNATPPVK